MVTEPPFRKLAEHGGHRILAVLADDWARTVLFEDGSGTHISINVNYDRTPSLIESPIIVGKVCGKGPRVSLPDAVRLGLMTQAELEQMGKDARAAGQAEVAAARKAAIMERFRGEQT